MNQTMNQMMSIESYGYVKQGCRNCGGGGKGLSPFQIFEQIMPTTTLLAPPRIFRPSYGPAWII